MKKTFIWLVASLLFTMVGCVEGLQESGMTETSSEQLPNLTAGFAEEETKTYVESGKYLRWHEDDRLTAFFGNTRNRQYKFDGATGNNSGSFSYVPSGNLETGNALDRIYAVYPYDETATITDDGQISLTLPAVQTYAENSFGRGANTMLAATENVEDTFLGFKNACGYLKLKFYNAEGATIKSIEVKGNGDEKIAGAATATMAFGETPQLTMADDATTAITLDCGDGVALGTTTETATEFWVVIPETTFEGGITITVTDTEGGIFEKSTTKEVVIERNAVQPMAALKVECIKRAPKNVIWYTAIEKVEPYNKTVFGATYQSNEWDSETGKGVIKFDAPVTSIGERAFYCCYSLTSVTIPDSVTEIGIRAFTGCSLTSVTIPDSVTTIGSHAFLNCGSLASVTIPNSVTEIGNMAFSGCSSLTSVYITDITAWCHIDFYNSSSNPLHQAKELYINKELVTDLIIPDSVTEIRNDAFSGCSSLTSVTIPESVTTIGNSAFSGCSSLASITIPNSVTEIGKRAFSNCINLQEFKGTFASADGRCLIMEGMLNSFAPAGITEYTIPNSVTSIGNDAFRDCSSLAAVTIPNSVNTIGEMAFSGCSNLAAVTIPNSVTEIGRSAFYGCSSLAAVTIPNSVNTIGERAFYGCSSLAAVTIPNSVTTIGYEAFYRCSSLTSVTIGDSVNTIGERAFYGCSNLTGVTIPDSVTEIGNRAFYGCSSLASMTIPNSVTTIGYEAFWGYTGELIINSKIVETDYSTSGPDWLLGAEFTKLIIGEDIRKIGNYAFNDHSSLTSVTIGNSVNTIGESAFSGCSSLAAVTIPNSVTEIGNHAFFDCSSLASVTIGNGVTEIGDWAFWGCSSLVSITIPNSVTEIGNLAFYQCGSLTSVTIPESVTTIGNSAFFSCWNLKSVSCKAIMPPSLKDNVFLYSTTLGNKKIGCKIYVPMQSVEAYKSASNWDVYANEIVGYNF